jgi:hypothetical protein
MESIEILYDGNEYHKEWFIKDMINKYYPAASQLDMKTDYYPEIRTFVTTGSLEVFIPLPSGELKRQVIYAVGASVVEGSKEDKSKPSQPDDRAKASLTVWWKLIGKQLGIGIDIHHQQITPELEKLFWESVEPYQEYAGSIIKEYKYYTKGKSVRDLIRVIPNKYQAERMKRISDVLIKAGKDEACNQLWSTFVKFRNDSENNVKQIEKFLSDLEIKLKLNGD